MPTATRPRRPKIVYEADGSKATLPDGTVVRRDWQDSYLLQGFNYTMQHPDGWCLTVTSAARLYRELRVRGDSHEYAKSVEDAADRLRATAPHPLRSLRTLLALIDAGDLVVDPTNRRETEADIAEARRCVEAMDPE